MAIKNKDLIDISQPFDEVIKQMQLLVETSAKLSKTLSTDLKKSLEDLSKSPTGDLQKKYEDTKISLEKANKEFKENKALLNELKKIETESMRLQAQKITLDSKDYKANRELNEELRRRKKSIEDDVKLARVHRDSLAAKEIKLRQLKQQYRESGSAIAQQMLPQIKKLDTEVKKLNSAIGNNQGKVGSYFKTFVQGAASMATMYVSFQGFTRLIRSTFGIMTSFEKTMSGVAAISGATGTELQKLEEDAKRLGATTSKTATEVARLQVEYAKLGFTTQEILNATEATVLLSQATGEDLARSAEIAGATIRGFGMDASESSRVVDVMAASFTSSALNLERFAEAMKYVAPVAKASGITLEQTAAMMSKLADAGIHGSMAGTALRQIMLEMAKAGKTGMQGFNEMAKAGLSLADANDEVGQRAATALLILSENEKAVNSLTESYNNAEGAAKKMADTQMDNLSGSIVILSSAWEGLLLKLTKGDGVLRKIVDGLTSFLTFLTRNVRIIVNVAKAIATLTTAFLAYRTAIFLTNTQVGIYIASLISKNAVLSLSTIRTYALAKAQAALNAIMKLNPFVLVASALAAVTMAMATQTEEAKLLYDELGRTNEEYEDMYKNLTEIEKIQKQIKDIAGEGLVIGQLDVAKSTLRIFQEAWDNGLSMIETERGAILLTEELIKGQEKRVAELESQLNELKKKRTEIKKKEIKKENEHTKKLAEEHIKRIEQQRDFRTSELKLWGAGQSAIFASEQRFNEQILELRKKYGLLNEIEYKTQANKNALARKEQQKKELEDTKAMFKEMNKAFSIGGDESGESDIPTEKKLSKDEMLMKFLGVDENQLNELKSIYSELAAGLDEIFTRMNEKWQRAINSFNTKISEQNSIVQREQEAMLQGQANTYEQEKQRLLELQAVRDEAVEREKQNNIIQLRLQQAEKLGALSLAAANLLSNGSKLGPIGIAAAGISALGLIGTMAAVESQIQGLKKYREGGLLEGASHENGGVLLVNNGRAIAEAEGGEFILNREATKNSPIIANMINEHKITDREILPALRVQRELRLLGIDENTSATKDLTKALMQGNEIVAGGYKVRRVGRNLTRSRI